MIAQQLPQEIDRMLETAFRKPRSRQKRLEMIAVLRGIVLTLLLIVFYSDMI